MNHQIMFVKYQFDHLGGCRGDSGAPLWIKNDVPSSIKDGPCSKKNILVGVVSAGIPSKDYFEPPCSSTSTVAYKITENILAWIRKNMQRYDS